MDIKYKVGQEVYVTDHDIISNYELTLEDSEDVQALIKDVDNIMVIKEPITVIHVHGEDDVRYETRSRVSLRDENISLTPGEAKRNAIKELQDRYVREQIRLLLELDDGLSEILDRIKDSCERGKIKVVRAEAEYLQFSDGSTITSQHDPDCCEYNYADFSQIDDLGREWEFEHPILFEKSEYGFRFGNKDKMVFVPCYSSQNGYYSYSVDIYYNNEAVLEDLTCADDSE